MVVPTELTPVLDEKITKQRGSEASPYFDGCFARILCARCKMSPYVHAY